MTFTIRENRVSLHDIKIDAYKGLAFLPNYTRAARAGSIVSLNLFCGCSSELRNYPMGYVMGESDSIESLAIRFGSGKLIIEDDDEKDDDDEDDDDKDEDDVEDKLYRLIQIPMAGQVDATSRLKQSRSEKKSRKAMLKLGMKFIPGVSRVTVKKSKKTDLEF
ncbi:lysM domain receptor-like kinase 3 [Impatiens glandulifera]|uniref:lysM domain receptor-like kinase 3 n=1 Tax=Impatiens glandulifera TaxID=253017 RepID=UPI001FB0D8D3|nr:lysM domain receptor-like kinase 3 [Impatiens glandulifera]